MRLEVWDFQRDWEFWGKKKEGKRDRIKKLGNRAKVLFDKQRNGAEDVRAGSYFVKHLEMNFRNDI